MATVLAAAERSGASGREVIAAIVAGYEIDGRIRDIGVGNSDFDYVTYIGLAAAATSGRLLGLDRERLADALALAATYSPALGVVRGGHISAAKWLGSGLGGQTGISITAYMMMPDDVKITADRIYQILSAKRPEWKPEVSSTPAGVR